MIHTYSFEGRNIVIDIPSGSIHVVSDEVKDILDGVSEKELELKYKASDLAEAREEIACLEQEGILNSVDESQRLVEKFPRKPLIKAMCLHVAHDCNLRCEYCFASTGDFHSTRELMDLVTGKKALDFLISHSGNRRNLEVDFFGGEPLMNWEVVKQLVAYGREIEKEHGKNFRFTMTTNGVLLNDEITEFLNKEMFNVVLSIDGRKSVNDNMRKTLNNSSSYDVIVPKFQDFVKKRSDKNHYIRGTYTAFNTDFCADILHFRDLGFKELSMEPVVSEPGLPYTLEEKHLPELYAQYEQLAKEMLKSHGTEEDFRFFHYELDLQGGPCAVKRASGCGAGVEYIAVTPKGEVYPCHQFVGNEAFLMGTIHEGITQPDVQKKFMNLSIFEKEDCTDCWAKYYCSGGCHANAYNFNQDLRIPYEIACQLERKRVEMAIWLTIEKELLNDSCLL